MNLGFVTLIIIIVLGSIFFTLRAQAKDSEVPRKADPAIYQEMRNAIFQGSRESFSLAKSTNPNEPWGVVMDVGLTDGGSHTVTAISDGSASIYLSSGGGFIGGIAHQSIRNAAQKMVKTASTFIPKMAKTKNKPLPPPGNVSFYVLTDNGVFTATADENELGEEKHLLSPLFYAAQDIITEYRRIKEKQ